MRLLISDANILIDMEAGALMAPGVRIVVASPNLNNPDGGR